MKMAWFGFVCSLSFSQITQLRVYPTIRKFILLFVVSVFLPPLLVIFQKKGAGLAWGLMPFDPSSQEEEVGGSM